MLKTVAASAALFAAVTISGCTGAEAPAPPPYPTMDAPMPSGVVSSGIEGTPPMPPALMPGEPGYDAAMADYNQRIETYMCEYGNAYTVPENQRNC